MPGKIHIQKVRKSRLRSLQEEVCYFQHKVRLLEEENDQLSKVIATHYETMDVTISGVELKTHLMHHTAPQMAVMEFLDFLTNLLRPMDMGVFLWHEDDNGETRYSLAGVTPIVLKRNELCRYLETVKKKTFSLIERTDEVLFCQDSEDIMQTVGRRSDSRRYSSMLVVPCINGDLCNAILVILNSKDSTDKNDAGSFSVDAVEHIGAMASVFSEQIGRICRFQTRFIKRGEKSGEPKERDTESGSGEA